MAELLAPALSRYLEDLVPPRPPELAAMETQGRQVGFPIIGPAAGQFCYLIARLMGARRIFEMGSGYGYSTAWFARAVQENGGGVVYHVVWDEALSRRARGHLHRLGLDDVVQYHVGEAVQTLAQTPGPFDLIFNDIDKAGYPASLPVMAERLRPGGLLIIDNALWGGRIFDPADRSPATEGVRQLTRALAADPAWTTSLVPVRDGLLLAYRRP
ncbi:MAG TPA: O-methyltransferase [bacterium]|nr:O-methyltransferase [bacterium]